MRSTRPALRSRKASCRAAAWRCYGRRSRSRPRAKTMTRRPASTSLRRALQAPIRQIAENAGVEGSIVVGKGTDQKSASYGYDAQNNEYGDLIEKGIIDPAKVVRTALQDAASVAGLLVTTEAGVAEAPKKKEEHVHMPGGGMGGMDIM